MHHEEQQTQAARHTRPKSMINPAADDTGIIRIDRSAGGGGSAPDREQLAPQARSPERTNPMVPRQQVRSYQ